ncbi:L-threonylcarbamoyladenylate synthase [Hyphococcus flavus]|uniref:Threonylcarbamoyl-AMP synthase n=1 Tax=Hyphococcus flavus TaxID=1866326 RepID=A0AAE9ZEG6_9PROT|nr:L-threonylcarbamoyladenylate synthase [Hyphococcus flavus]WDI32255.1 L-threonylcarbamoyladenylate synthase [Hyphococcus flavus]
MSNDTNGSQVKTPMAINDAVDQAKDVILSGGLVAMPTETVYGLAADATNDSAVARIFEAKGRPQFNPLIIHVSGAEMAKAYVEFSPMAEKLEQAFWPGPLTLVLPRREDSPLSLLVSAGLDTVGVRMPDHLIAQTLIKAVERPLAAPSANQSGGISPTRAEDVRQSLDERVDMIIDGGQCTIGVESTIVKVEDDNVTLLRPGGVPREDIGCIIGKQLLNAGDAKIEAPGMMTSHYAPDAVMRLNANSQEEGEVFLGYGKVSGSGEFALNLSQTGDLREAAANLFSHLRALDRMAAAHGLKTIAAARVPMEGLGEAINDRLKRAAAPR